MFTFVVIAVLGSVTASAVFMPGCTQCHSQGPFGAATAAGAHAGIECKACHGGTTLQSRAEFGANQVFGMVLRVVKVDPTVAIAQSDQCRACHSDQLKGKVDNEGLRIFHEKCAVDRECRDCHSATAHGAEVSWPRSSTMDMCYDCHGKGSVKAECNTCHQERMPSERIQTGVFAATHGENWRKTHGMGGMNTCSACHQSSKCAKCHGVGLPHAGDFVKTHGDLSRQTQAKCTQCHRKSFCNDCHGYEMPHPKQFLNTHAERSEKDGKETCQKCHAPSDCEQCHLDHVHPTTTEQMRALGKLPAAPRATTPSSSAEATR